MQKKLLSLLMVTTCGIMYGETPSTAQVKKNEKVPAISDAEHTQNKKTYDELAAKEKSLQEQIKKCQDEKDNIEIKMHSHLQRKNYRDALLKEANGIAGAIKKCETEAKSHTAKIHTDEKQKDNGIERAWFIGVTSPVPGSRADVAYGREDKRATGKGGIDDQLSDEHVEYSKVYAEKVLPALNKNLIEKSAAIDTVYVPAFVACSGCRDNFDAFVKCLSKKGVSKDAISGQFVDSFVDNAYEEASEEVRKHGIPFTTNEVKDSAEQNTITKDAAAKAKVAQDRFKKALNGESLDHKPEIPGEKKEPKTPTQNPPAPKPNIVPDKK